MIAPMASKSAPADPSGSSASEQRPVVGVQAAVFSEEGILLQRRLGVFGSGTWGLPGGHLEFGESFEEAAARELEEETGLHATELRTVIPHNTAYSHSHYVQIAVEVLAWHGAPAIREPERCSDLAFFPRYRLPKPLFEPSQAILDHLFDRSGSEPDYRLRLELGRRGHWLKLMLHGSSHPLVVIQSRSQDEQWRMRTRSNTFARLDTALQWIQQQLGRRLAAGYDVRGCSGDLPLDRILTLFPTEHPVGLKSLGGDVRAPCAPGVNQLELFVESETR